MLWGKLWGGCKNPLFLPFKKKEVTMDQPELVVKEKAPLPHLSTTLTIQKKINITEFSHKVFLGLPDNSVSLDCTSYDYDTMSFTFWDCDEKKEHILTKEKIELGMSRFLQRCLNGEWNIPILNDISALLCVENWYPDITDMAIQICIFDDIIYV